MTGPSRTLSISNMEHSAATARLGSGGSQGISFAAGTLLQPFVSVIAGVLSPILLASSLLTFMRVSLVHCAVLDPSP